MKNNLKQIIKFKEGEKIRGFFCVPKSLLDSQKKTISILT